MRAWTACAVVLGLCVMGAEASAQETFADLVGPVKVQPVKAAAQTEVPFITWGGDVATFLANDGLTTRPGTIFAKQGLKIKLVNGDDFVGQVRRYMGGQTPFLRGTFRMLGLASEVIGSDPRTKPVIFLQLTWSAGDHIVARKEIANLNALAPKGGKKVRIACQKGGPHVGLIDDVLRLARLKWNDVEIVWVPDLTGDNGPAALFSKDPSVDACCVISPDMMGLTGGLRSAGTGAEGTVKGAHVVASTADISRSIADVYACRSDWFKANRPFVEKFAAGYLKASEQMVPMRAAYEAGKMSAAYKKVLTTAQTIFGKEVIPEITVDGHGLLLDCEYVGLYGNDKFFNDKGFTDGYAAKLAAALDLAVNQGWAKQRKEFATANFDYTRLAKTLGIDTKPLVRRAEISADFEFNPDVDPDPNTLFTFTIHFEPEQRDFPVEKYREFFDHAVRSASTAGNAMILIRGHSDPTLTLRHLVQSGIKKQIIRRTGPPNIQYSLKTANGTRPLDLEQTKTLVDLIKAGAFEGVEPSPKLTMEAAKGLSMARAEKVKERTMEYAKQMGLNFEEGRFQPVGAGILDPMIPRPRNIGEAKQNMRVEFRIVRTPAEATKATDFEF